MKKLIILFLAVLPLVTLSQVNMKVQGSMNAIPNSTIQVPIQAGMTMIAGAISLTLDYPADQMDVTDVTIEGGYCAFVDYGSFVRIGWFGPPFLYLSAGSTMIVITCHTSTSFTKASFTLHTDPDNEIADNNFNPIPGAMLTTPVVKLTPSLTPKGSIY